MKMRFLTAVAMLLALHTTIPHEGLHALLAAQLSQQLAPTDSLNAQCQDSDLAVSSQQKQAILVACGPRYTPTIPADQIEGVPLCTDHDKTRWHALVKRDANGSVLCTYGHEHHDNPHGVDDIFGPVGAWWGGSQEISYPWQTKNATTGALENDAKHEGYKWLVKRDLPCVADNHAQYKDGCITAFRVEGHTRGDQSDANTRFHSFSVEAQVRTPSGIVGIARFAGHLDGGHLALAADGAPDGFVCPGISQDPPGFACGHGVQRRHSGHNVPAPYADHNAYIAGWYANPLTIFLEEWGPIDYRNPTDQLFFGEPYNNSRGRVGNLAIDPTADFWLPYTSNYRVNFTGYADRAANWTGNYLSSSCSAPSFDCWPVKYEGVGSYGYYFAAAGDQSDPRSSFTEHDVKSPVTGHSLIRFPN